MFHLMNTGLLYCFQLTGHLITFCSIKNLYHVMCVLYFIGSFVNVTLLQVAVIAAGYSQIRKFNAAPPLVMIFFYLNNYFYSRTIVALSLSFILTKVSRNPFLLSKKKCKGQKNLNNAHKTGDLVLTKIRCLF